MKILMRLIKFLIIVIVGFFMLVWLCLLACLFAPAIWIITGKPYGPMIDNYLEVCERLFHFEE
jgi:hypothetical protein